MQRTLNPPREQVKNLWASLGTWPVILSVGVLTLLLAFVNLAAAPAPWFDEGSHLQVPKTLVMYGVYADRSSEGFRYFGPTIGVGPTVMLPIAAAFQMFGVSFLAGRFVIVSYLLLAIVLAFFLARRIHGQLAASLSVILLLASRTVSFEGMIEYGRQVLGEVPGIAFLFFGCLMWSHALSITDPRRRTLLAILSGLGFGLALITKNQFALIVGPGLALIALLDLIYYRQAGWLLRIVPLAIAGACFTGWMLIAITILGPGAFAENLALTRKAAGGAIFVFDLQATLRALRYMIQPYGGLLIPALLYGLWRSRTRDAAALAELPLVLLPLLWLAWYMISLGWPRYAFPAVALGAFAVARLLIDAVTALRSRTRPRSATLVVVYAVAVISVPLSLTTTSLLQPNDAAYRMGDYLRANVPSDTIIETWEPELGVITEHTFHFPPTEILDDAVRGKWLNGAGPQYPLPTEPPAYLIVGPFGHYSGIYTAWLAAGMYTIETEIGPYVLFRLKSTS